MTPPPPVVSIVVPTRNVARTLRACLESARRQVGVATEVVVVDNGSDDGSWQIAEELADVATQAGPERSAQRNEGVRLARGDWVLWIDADMVLPPDTAASAVAAARAAGAVAVFIDEVTIGPGFWTACRALERRCYVGEELIEAPRLVQRSVLLEQPFDEALSGTEDADLRMRLLRARRPLARSAGPAIVHDEGRLGVIEVMRKRYYYGLGIRRYAANNPGAAGAQVSATLAAYRRNWRLLARDPLHAMGLVALRSAEVAAYLAAMAVTTLRRD